MADALTVRTARLLTDYLQYCARGPGRAARPPPTREAAVLRYLAAQAREHYRHVWSCYRGYQGSRVELVAWVARELFHDCRVLTWGRVVALVSFSGMLLEGPPPRRTRRLKRWEAEVDGDCQRLVALLCDWLTVRHRAWLEAHGGWVSGARAAGRGRDGRSGHPGTRPRGQPPRQAAGRSFRQLRGTECELRSCPLWAEAGWKKLAFLDGSLVNRSEAPAHALGLHTLALPTLRALDAPWLGLDALPM